MQICSELAKAFYEPDEGVRALRKKLRDHLDMRLEHDWDLERLHVGSEVVLCRKKRDGEYFHLDYYHR